MSEHRPTYTETLAHINSSLEDLRKRIGRLEDQINHLKTAEAVQDERFVAGKTVLIWIGGAVVAVVASLASILALK